MTRICPEVLDIFTTDGARMERIYDILQRITSLWKELELTKPESSEYVALLNRIRVLSPEPGIPSIEVLSISPRDPKPDPDATMNYMRKIWMNREARYRSMYRATK
jgi:hypothetical protein